MIRNAVLNRIKALFVDRGGRPAEGRRHGGDELQLAAAALLVEAARMDDDIDASERAKIADLVKHRFALSDEEAATLLDAAEEWVAESTQLFAFTRVVNDRFSFEERVELLEMLWQVVYVDGRLHDHEASLMRRIAGLIHVPDRDSGEARKRALARLGLDA
ncbi:MAG: TerB family tellurite resistance protein [Kiloniellales bacterium]